MADARIIIFVDFTISLTDDFFLVYTVVYLNQANKIMADKQGPPVGPPSGKEQASEKQAPPHRPAMYPVPANFTMVPPSSVKRGAPQAGPHHPSYSMHASHGRYHVPYHPGMMHHGMPYSSPYTRQPMGSHPLMNHRGTSDSASIPKSAPKLAQDKMSQSSSIEQPIHTSKPQANSSGQKKPVLVSAKTPMDIVQPVPTFSSRPPRWTENEVSPTLSKRRIISYVCTCETNDFDQHHF